MSISNLSLWQKLVILASIPLLALIILSVITLNSEYRDYKLILDTKMNSNLTTSTSGLIHELQKERGKSSLFVGGAISASEIEAQRKLTDDKNSLFSEALKDAHIDAEYISKAINAIQELNKLRNDVDAKRPAVEIVPRYTATILNLLNIHKGIATARTTKEISDLFRNVSIVEEAKENAGKFRAILAGILSRNVAVTNEQLFILILYKSGIDTNLHSLALSFTEESEAKLKRIEASNEWASVNDIFTKVVMNAEQGNYGMDASSFFSTISTVVDDLALLVNDQVDDVRNKVDSDLAKHKKVIWTSVFYILIVVLGVIILSITTIMGINKPIKNIIERLGSSAKELTGASDQVSSSSRQLAASSSEMASTIEEITASIDELQSIVGKTRENLNKADEMMKDTVKGSQKSSMQMGKMQEAMMEITGQSRKIGEITNVINDIAFQTNILSLNAAIEAARAGDAGRGFAVVAEQVKSLASKSSEAAKEIAVLIEGAISCATNGEKMASEVSQTQHSYGVTVEKVGILMREINHSSEREYAETEMIAGAINEINKVVQQGASYSEENAAAGEQLLTHAEILQHEMVGQLVKVVDGSKKVETYDN